jgi:hypothetical protein
MNPPGLCVDCYDLGGLENQVSDRGATPELLAEIARLEARIAVRIAAA